MVGEHQSNYDDTVAGDEFDVTRLNADGTRDGSFGNQPFGSDQGSEIFFFNQVSGGYATAALVQSPQPSNVVSGGTIDSTILVAGAVSSGSPRCDPAGAAHV